MQINIKPHNRFRNVLHKLASKTEDVILALLLWITQYWQPDFLMNWIDQYTQKRINQLQRDHVRDQWRMVSLEDAIKQMREQKSGLIINIGSITGAEGDGYGMDYPTSKAGLMYGLTKSIAQFGAKYGIRCVCVSPGPVLTRAAMANMKTLLGRAAEPQEVIDLILFIASDKGQFINGENIMIDGGRNAMKRP